MLQPGQLVGQRLVGLHQLRDRLRLRPDLPGLLGHHDDEFVARHLLRPGHQKIEPYPSRSTLDRHATWSCPTTRSPKQRRGPAGLNAYPVPPQNCSGGFHRKQLKQAARAAQGLLVPDRGQIPFPFRLEDPLPQPPYVVLMSRQSTASHSVTTSSGPFTMRCPTCPSVPADPTTSCSKAHLPTSAL